MILTTVRTNIYRINLREGIIQKIDDTVAVEAPIKIIVNGKRIVTLSSLPKQLKELGIGWLLSQAIIMSIDEIVNVKVRGNSVSIKCSSDVESRLRFARISDPIDSSCTSTPEDFALLIDRLKKPHVNSGYRIEAQQLIGFVRVLNRRAILFSHTGGTHSAAIFCKKKLVAFAEDVGRHNAVDKVVGAAAMKKVDFAECLLASSGRQPANMVLKAARVGIPVVASIAGPLSSGIDAAKKTGVTLVCFVRDQRMNIYSCHERIQISSMCASK